MANFKSPLSVIKVPVVDFVLTPRSCANLVNEVMINLLYQRSQIPYPYVWLKNIIKKKRHSQENEGDDGPSTNFTLNKHYRTVSKVYDSVEQISSEITKAFKLYSDRIKEVIFIIGATPLCPKEIFTVKISSLSLGHQEQNHFDENKKKLAKILRSIFLENIWMSLIENTISCSTLYTFFKLEGDEEVELCQDSIFVPTKPLVFPSKVKHIIINLDYVETNKNKCCDLNIFKDDLSEQTPTKVVNIIDTPNVISCKGMWLQSSLTVGGFKDCFVNKVSASELW